MPFKLLNILIGLITLSYPLLIYFGINKLPLGAFAGLLAILFGGRLLVAARINQQMNAFGRLLIPMTGLVVLFALSIWLLESKQLLLYYPVLVNLAMLVLFTHSLLRPPSIIEQLARISEPALPPEGVRYTRNVTWVWCFFFVSMPV